MKKKLLILSILALFFHATSCAYDFYAENEDGVTIYYNILSSSDRTCEVTGIYSNSLSGVVIIPETATYLGKTYSVMAIGSSAFENCYELTSVTIPNSVTSIGGHAFYQCTGLTGELIIPNSVTWIGSGAFFSCSGLTEVTIPNSMTSISDELFMYCRRLTSVTIPESVTRIGDSAFMCCSGLTGPLIIPNSVTEIGENAFYDCEGLTSLTIGDRVTSIGKEAFDGCTGLTGPLIIPNGVTRIRSNTFCGCSGLTSVTIPESVTSIGNEAFDNCTGLTEVTIPNSVTSIGDYTFSSCDRLTSLTIGNSVESIGSYAFCECYGLKNIYSLNPQPPTCSSYGYGVFNGVDKSNCTLYVPEGAKGVYSTADQWQDFLNIVEIEVEGVIAPTVQTDTAVDVTDNSATLSGTITAGDEEILEQGFEYWAEGGEVQTITATGEGMSVNISGLTQGTTYTFRAYATTKSGTTYGKEMTFTTLSEDEYPDFFEVDGIYYNVVSSTNNTCEVTYKSTSSKSYTGNVEIPATLRYNNNLYSVVDIGDKAFYQCTGLTGVTLPNSIETIGDEAFYGCSSLTSITIPNSVTTIGDDAFRNCTGLTSVTIPESVTSIGKSAFAYCSGLTEVNFNAIACTSDGYIVSGSGNGTIIYTVFNNCSNLSIVSIGDDVTQIPDWLFYGCSGLAEVTTGNCVNTIGEWAFCGCTGLTSVTIPNGVTRIGDHAFEYCTGLMSVTIPNSVITIGNNAFQDCYGLESVTIGNSVTEIGSYAFRFCMGLTQLTIGESVMEIGSYAFYGCTGLTSIYSLNSEPPAFGGTNVFYNVNTNTCVLYVPEGSLEAYSTADQWKDFLNIVDNQPNAIEDIVNGNSNVNGEIVGYYTTDGKKIPSLQRGINIIRYSNGSAKKVLVK